jgi:hypothetical protein
MLCPLQAHSRELIVCPNHRSFTHFRKWIVGDPKEQSESDELR